VVAVFFASPDRANEEVAITSSRRINVVPVICGSTAAEMKGVTSKTMSKKWRDLVKIFTVRA